MNKALLIRNTENGSAVLYSDGSIRESDKRPVKLLNEKCLDNGSSLEGRMDSFRHILSVRQKAAVLISEVTQEIWFPTLSMKSKDCVWLRFDQILDTHSASAHRCEIVFFSGVRTEIDIDVRTIRLQMKRCHQFLEILNHNTGSLNQENTLIASILNIS